VRTSTVVLLAILFMSLLLLVTTGCAAITPEDRSLWSAEMKQEYTECEEWAVMAPMNHHRPDGSPMSTGDWLKRCLRGRGWSLR
jgi:hypothetical protein